MDDIPESFFSNIDQDIKNSVNFINYTPISEFPSSTRDFSFSIKNPASVNLVFELLENLTDPIIKSIFLFDFYKNEEKNLVKIGYRIIFQSDSKTLLDNEINKKIEEILSPVLEIDGVSIPGNQ